MNEPCTRRRVLAGATAAVGGLAGCLGGSDDGGNNETMADSGGADGGITSADDGEENDSSGDGPSADDPGGEDGASGEEGANASDGDGSGSNSDLDLQEANVTAVSIEEAGDREFEFSVTLYHDDAGEDGYADWWAVETKDVEELGRRELTHGHGTEEFSRSASIEIPEGVGCVVVRGHDQTHGYGGQAMLVSIPSGATEPQQQGSDPSAFADADCP